MNYDPGSNFFGWYTPNDGTVDFYGRVNSILRSDMTVLDLGAGRAAWFEDDKCDYKRNLRHIKNKVTKLIAVDVDQAVFENKSSHECLLMEDDRIPLEDNSVDLIIADYVLEHIQEPMIFAIEVDRVLKNGGYFCARTPHKWNYVSIFARLIENSKHSFVLKFVQPFRKEVDIFPTAYLMNSSSDIESFFIGYRNKTFIYRSEPSYFFGSKFIYNVQYFIHRILPLSVVGNLFIFLQKGKT